jgi:hypothetical protein
MSTETFDEMNYLMNSEIEKLFNKNSSMSVADRLEAIKILVMSNIPRSLHSAKLKQLLSPDVIHTRELNNEPHKWTDLERIDGIEKELIYCKFLNQ